MTQTFIGFEMSQDWADFTIWETFFRENEVKTMIELGTDNGGMSIYFALQGYERHMYFHTFDNQKWIDFDKHGLPRLLRLGEVFHHVDLFSDDGYNEVKLLIETMPHPLAIFFDDGDKPREWKMFAPLTIPGDFLIVHDWGKEFHQKDIGDVPVKRILVAQSNLRPKSTWKSVWFKRV